MDPMELIRKAVNDGKIPEEYEKKAELGVSKVTDAIGKVEKSSGAKYPVWFVSPYAVVMKGGNLYSEAIVYSRFMPLSDGTNLILTVELTAPLVAFGSKDTIASAVAHEFLHYLNFLALLRDRTIRSSSITDQVIEALGIDEGELYTADLVYSKSKYLIRVLDEKFRDGLNDDALNKKSIVKWINAGLPTVIMSPSENQVKLPMVAIMNYIPEERVRRLLKWT
ncbi:MAG: hypothetical protein M1291_01265 [Thaumarchaeota archaeon]|jgi:hypothetical protein|nr:hypothetical protein [Nitrososphaerota archaeon]